MDKKAILAILVVLVFIFGVNALLRIYVGELKEEQPPVPRALQAVPKQEADVSQRPSRQPDDPAKFGIVVMDSVETPANQEEWDAFIEKVLDKSGVLDTEEAKAAVDRMKMNPTQFQKTMRRLDEEIAKIEEASKSNSFDPLLKRRREVLYQMKAMSRVLERKGVVDPNAATLTEYDLGVSAVAGSGVPLK
jgi:hypothetical protein